jgi:hypothetical protein
VSLLGLHLIDFVGLSAIAARSFAPTRTDPADRIHGWIELGWGVFFFHYRLPKVGTEIQPPLKTPGALVLLPLYQESLTRLDCLSLSRLIYLFFLFRSVHPPIRNSPEFSPPRPRVRWVIKIGYICILVTVVFSSFSLLLFVPVLLLEEKVNLLDLLSPCRLRITRSRLLGMSTRYLCPVPYWRQILQKLLAAQVSPA